MKPTTTGTALTEASVNRAALTGRVGMTTANSDVQTATHDRPIQPFMSSREGSMYSAMAIP